MKAVNFAGTARPTSLFHFPVTFAVTRLSAFACKKKANKHDSSIGTWPAKVFSTSGRVCGVSVLISAAPETRKIR